MSQSSTDPGALLLALEERLVDPLLRRDRAAVAALLTDDFREFGSSGHIYTKPAIIAALADEAPHTIGLTDFACQLAAPGVALVTYWAASTLAGENPVASLRSSVWVVRDARWQMLFHQGTRL